MRTAIVVAASIGLAAGIARVDVARRTITLDNGVDYVILD